MDYVNVDLWYFVDTTEAVIMEVALFHHTFLHSDSSMQGRTEAIDNAAGDLVAGTLWINDASAVHGTRNAVDPEGVLSGRDLGDFRHPGALVVAGGDAPAPAVRQ